jgi:hypothetical protein
MSFALAKRGLALPAALLALAGIALGAFAASARANAGETIVQRCLHGQSVSGFSQQAYAEALKDLTAGTEEYSNCSSLIHQAQLTAAAGGAGAGAGGAGGIGLGGASGAPEVALTPTPAEQQAIAHAVHAGAAPVRVAGKAIVPGVVHANISSAVNTLPTPLLAAVAFILVCLALAAGGALRNRVRGRGSR